jgi:Galactose oxidase, central domain
VRVSFSWTPPLSRSPPQTMLRLALRPSFSPRVGLQLASLLTLGVVFLMSPYGPVTPKSPPRDSIREWPLTWHYAADMNVTGGVPSTDHCGGKTGCAKKFTDFFVMTPSNEAPQPVASATVLQTGDIRVKLPPRKDVLDWAGTRVSALWAQVPDYPPGGLQDVAHAVLRLSDHLRDRVLMTTSGWCGGGSYNNCEPRSFRSDTWLLNLTDNQWRRGPDFPAMSRQGMVCAQSSDGQAFCGGGYRYSPLTLGQLAKDPDLAKRPKNKPLGFGDWWKIGGNLQWTRMSDTPYLNAYPALAVIPNGTIVASLFCNYTQNYGSIVDAECETSPPVLFYDPTADRWSHAAIEPFPGTWRLGGALAATDRSLFVFGGRHWLRSVLDNWRLDLRTRKWHRISTNPWISWIHFSTGVILNRYVVLPANVEVPPFYNFGIDSALWEPFTIERLNTSVREKKGFPIALNPRLFSCQVTNPPAWHLTMCSDIVLYDTQRDIYVNHAKFRKPVGMSEPMYVFEDELFFVGGESAAGENQIFINGEDYSGRHFRGGFRAKVKAEKMESTKTVR